MAHETGFAAVTTSRVSFEQASQSLMDAAVDSTRWTAAMEMVARYSGSTGAVLLSVKGRGPGTPHSRSLEEGLDVYFRDGWHLRDERNRGLPFIRHRGIFVDQDFATKEELATSDYYRGFLAKFACNWSAVVGFNDPDDEWCLVFERGDSQGHFDERAKADLVRFAAPLSQAAAMARALNYASAAGALDAYESIGCASFLVNHHGRVIRHNEQAQRLLGDGLEMSNGILRCSHPSDTSMLAKLVAAHQYKADGAAGGNPLVVVRRQTKRPLVIRGVPLKGAAENIFSSATTILLVSDTEKRSSPTTSQVLVKTFGLTSTEAVLVNNLEREMTLQEAAELMNISFETARTHLKHIFMKTQTRRQAELLMLLRRIEPLDLPTSR